MGHIPVLLMYEIVKTEYKISKSKLLISKIEWNFQLINCIMLMLNRSVVSSSLRPHFFFSGKNTGMGCHFLLQRIFLTQGSNLHLLCWQVDSLPLSHLRSHKLQTYDSLS